MKIGIMQPYFFPHLAHFELINSTQQWVCFDSAQYTSKTWMNRNRIMHPSDTWQFVTVAVHKQPLGTSVSDILIKDIEKQYLKIKGQLNHYKNKAPYFNEVMNIVERTFIQCQDNKLATLNHAGLKEVCNYLGITFNARFSSEFISEIKPVAHAGQWALNICNYLGTEHYVNPIGGKSLFNPDEFRTMGIDLSFLESTPKESVTLNVGREDIKGESLSVLDVMMWNDPKTILNSFSGQLHKS